ncbi:MAG TPA: hypothetical protein VLS89_14310 [Candidatus Nanopelagicales bacterium]|nr:hypothetical protein [Candidatus Nanopelagicales bacterium]
MADPYEDLEIVGATPAPDDDIAPHRLNPIYRRRGTADVLYTLTSEEDAGPPSLAAIARSDIDALLEDGDAVLFERPITARPAHALVHMQPGQQPEYVPLDDLHILRRRAASDAISRAAREMASGDGASVESLVWYARRADPDDPLPLLLLTLLLRDDPDVELLHRDLLHYSPSAIEASWERLRRNSAWAALVPDEATASSPLAPRPTPEYLRPYAPRPKLLREARLNLGRRKSSSVAA